MPAVVSALRGFYNIKSDKAILVLHWLCRKADPVTREVVVISSEYHDELGLSQQNFHNYTRILRNAHVIRGERGIFEISHRVPFIPEDVDKFKVTIEFTKQN
jgi:hypothetical protein